MDKRVAHRRTAARDDQRGDQRRLEGEAPGNTVRPPRPDAGLECHPMEQPARNALWLKRMGIDTHEEPIVYMRADCHVCRSLGYIPTFSHVSINARLTSAGRSIVR